MKIHYMYIIAIMCGVLGAIEVTNYIELQDIKQELQILEGSVIHD